MRQILKMPKLGDTTIKVVILAWHADVGDSLSAGSLLVAVETDKAEVDVPSPVSGVLREQLVTLDEEVAVGQPIAILES